MKKVLIIIFILLLTGCNLKQDIRQNKVVSKLEDVYVQVDTSYIGEGIDIRNIDGDNTNYDFSYNNEIFKVIYINDTWKIYNSYKITNMKDIKEICKSLLEIHKIPSSDYKSYRTVEDMAYEWKQHNLAYQILPEGNMFRNSAKDVDLDPKDQGKSMAEIYEDRTGQKLDIGKLLNR